MAAARGDISKALLSALGCFPPQNQKREQLALASIPLDNRHGASATAKSLRSRECYDCAGHRETLCAMVESAWRPIGAVDASGQIEASRLRRALEPIGGTGFPSSTFLTSALNALNAKQHELSSWRIRSR
jgi:hypothetical protein